MRIGRWNKVLGIIALAALAIAPALASGESAQQAKPDAKDTKQAEATKPAPGEAAKPATEAAEKSDKAKAETPAPEAAQCNPQAPVNTLEDWFGVAVFAKDGSPALRRAKAVVGWQEVPATAVAAVPTPPESSSDAGKGR